MQLIQLLKSSIFYGWLLAGYVHMEFNIKLWKK